MTPFASSDWERSLDSLEREYKRAALRFIGGALVLLFLLRPWRGLSAIKEPAPEF